LTPFSIHPARPAGGVAARAAALAAAVVDPMLGLTTLGRLYAELPRGNFIGRALERLGIAVDVIEGELRHVPESGPAIVVANHPTGALDGLALAHAVMRRRSDVRLLGNHLLGRIPEMRDWVITVNPFDPCSIENRRGLRTAREWLRRGGLLVVFPAGEVSSVRRDDGMLVDPAWQRGALTLGEWSSAVFVPAFVAAQPSRWLRLAGLVHPRLRTALLPRELLRLRNRSVTLRFGRAVTGEALEATGGRAARLAYLRARSYALEGGHDAAAAACAPIAPAADVTALRGDIAGLLPTHELHRAGDYSVFCAPAPLLPAILPEIGRLREISFRGAGEGTGRDRDLDRFDRNYQHLFVWHHSRGEIAGAYRIGATDRLGATRKAAPLYTHTLFRLAPEFIRAAGPALELGRSFVRPEYQRDSIVLLLLWRGIGALVAREPRYRRLFGPVSISASYSRPARGALAAYLKAVGGAGEWRHHVRPRRPYPHEQWLEPLMQQDALGLEKVDQLIRQLEDGRGVPVLIRQYGKLGARVLGLGVDAAFGNCLDALMMVDLTKVSATILQRYLGREGAAAFRRYHSLA
jgi:putative hemolysin